MQVGREPSQRSDAMALQDNRAGSGSAGEQGVSRRRFMHTAIGTATLLPAVGALGLAGRRTLAADAPAAGAAAPAAAANTSETLVAGLYKSLDDGQRQKLCFGFDHPLRSA